MKNETFYDVESQSMITIIETYGPSSAHVSYSNLRDDVLITMHTNLLDFESPRFLRVPKRHEMVWVMFENFKEPISAIVMTDTARKIEHRHWKDPMPFIMVRYETPMEANQGYLPLYCIAQNYQTLKDRAQYNYTTDIQKLYRKPNRNIDAKPLEISWPLEGEISDFKMLGSSNLNGDQFLDYKKEITDYSMGCHVDKAMVPTTRSVPKYFGEPIIVVKSHIPSLEGRTIKLYFFLNNGAYVEGIDEFGTKIFLSRDEYDKLEVIRQHQGADYYTRKGKVGRPWEPHVVSRLAKKEKPWSFYTPKHCKHCGRDTGCMCPPKEN